MGRAILPVAAFSGGSQSHPRRLPCEFGLLQYVGLRYAITESSLSSRDRKSGFPKTVILTVVEPSRKTMETNLDDERQIAHALLDMLPAGKLNAVRGLLEAMVEPLARSLALASVEEEDVSPETAAALGRARDSLARGEGIPHEEILREFGLHQ